MEQSQFHNSLLMVIFLVSFSMLRLINLTRETELWRFYYCMGTSPRHTESAGFKTRGRAFVFTSSDNVLRGFEIDVDLTMDPGTGDIVMGKKKPCAAKRR